VQLYREGGSDGTVKPNAILFTTCIAAWSRAASNCPHAPERAEHLWEVLNDLYSETGCQDKDFEPSTELGNAVISAWSRCTSRTDSVQCALGALEKLRQASKADLISYNTVLDAMSKKGLGKEAMDLLKWLESETSCGPNGLMPDRVSYNSVLAALSRSNTNRCAAAEEAEKLLRKMEAIDGPVQASLSREQQRDRRPDKMSYTCKSSGR
jgi:pentatricopeptide repeat protein